MKYLTDEKRIKAVTVCFADLEGRLHMLDYDKKFLLKSADNLTFDGSSIRGFSSRPNRISGWPSTGRPPTGCRPTSSVPARSGLRRRAGEGRLALCGRHAGQAQELSRPAPSEGGYTCNAANEIEGFLFKGRDAERRYETGGFEFPSTGGYYHSLPGDALRLFIDTAAEVQRAMGSPTRRTTPRWRPPSSR